MRIDRFTQKMQEALQSAQDIASRRQSPEIGNEHFLLALLDQSEGVSRPLLEKIGVSPDALRSRLETDLARRPKVSGSQRITDQNPEGKYQTLEKYGRDLTQLARRGKIDPVIGRDNEIRRVMQVLSRRTKNNPVLIGEPGVGKTAIVEGLARRIV